MCDIQVCVQNCNWRMWKMANAEFETYYSTREHFVGCRWMLSLGRWYATSQKMGKGCRLIYLIKTCFGKRIYITINWIRLSMYCWKCKSLFRPYPIAPGCRYAQLSWCVTEILDVMESYASIWTVGYYTRICSSERKINRYKSTLLYVKFVITLSNQSV